MEAARAGREPGAAARSPAGAGGRRPGGVPTCGPRGGSARPTPGRRPTRAGGRASESGAWPVSESVNTRRSPRACAPPVRHRCGTRTACRSGLAAAAAAPRRRRRRRAPARRCRHPSGRRRRSPVRAAGRGRRPTPAAPAGFRLVTRRDDDRDACGRRRRIDLARAPDQAFEADGPHREAGRGDDERHHPRAHRHAASVSATPRYRRRCPHRARLPHRPRRRRRHPRSSRPARRHPAHRPSPRSACRGPRARAAVRRLLMRRGPALGVAGDPCAHRSPSPRSLVRALEPGLRRRDRRISHTSATVVVRQRPWHGGKLMPRSRSCCSVSEGPN
jgi:hypothetical protein